LLCPSLAETQAARAKEEADIEDLTGKLDVASIEFLRVGPGDSQSMRLVKYLHLQALKDLFFRFIYQLGPITSGALER
jgi:hypothetical protein